MRFATLCVVLLGILCSNAAISQEAGLAQPTGSHGLRNQQYGLFLRPRDASNKDGEPIVLYPHQPWQCMAWRFESAVGGTRLVNYFTSKSFEVQQSSSSKVLVQMPATAERQSREAVHFVALKDGLYEIQSEGGALTAIDSGGQGDIRVAVTPWRDTPAQRWQLVDIPAHFTM